MSDVGLYNKYTVINNDTGEEVTGCFVLKPYKDKAALEALKRYAEVTNLQALRRDLLDFISGFEEYRCVYNRICPITNTPVCCCHCENIDYCLQDEDIVCNYVRYNGIQTKSECEL